MCLSLIREPSWMGQHAQYPHYTLVSHLEGIPIIPGLTSTGLFGKTSSNVIRTHPYAHPQHMKVTITIHFVCVWQWSGSHLGWAYSLNKHNTLLVAPQRYPEFYSRYLPRAWLTSLAVTQKGLIHMHIHSIWRLWSALFIYVFDNEVGAILDGSKGSISSLHWC